MDIASWRTPIFLIVVFNKTKNEEIKKGFERSDCKFEGAAWCGGILCDTTAADRILMKGGNSARSSNRVYICSRYTIQLGIDRVVYQPGYRIFPGIIHTSAYIHRVRNAAGNFIVPERSIVDDLPEAWNRAWRALDQRGLFATPTRVWGRNYIA